MGVCCGACRMELKNEDHVVLDDVGILRHKGCYDFANQLHLIDTVGSYESVKGQFPAFMLSVYKEIIAMDEEETRSAHEISDEEVIEALAYTLGYIS